MGTAARIVPLILLALAGLAFGSGLGATQLWDLAELRFAEAAREMVATQEYFHIQLRYTPAADMPPLLVWWQALAIQALGVSELAVRLPNALLGALALVSVFAVGARLHGEDFGFLWAVLLAGCAGVCLLFRSALPEPGPAFFIFMTVATLAFCADGQGAARRGGSAGMAALAGFFLGMASLAQGVLAFGLIAPLLIAAWVWAGGKAPMSGTDALVLLLAALMTSAIWFGYEWAANGPAFIKEYLRTQLALPTLGHSGRLAWQAELVIALAGWFPAWPLGVRMLAGTPDRDAADFSRWMVLLVLLSVGMIMLLDGGLLLGLALGAYGWSYLGALELSQRLLRAGRINKPAWLALWLLCLAVGLGLILLPVYALRQPVVFQQVLRVLFKHSAPVGWQGWEGLGAIALLIGGYICYRQALRRNLVAAGLTLAGGCLLTTVLLAVPLAWRLQAARQANLVRLCKQIAPTLEKKGGYATVVIQPSLAPYFYARRPAGLPCNGQPDTCFTRHATRLPVFRIVPQWAVGSGRHLAGYEEVDKKGQFILFEKFTEN